MTDRDRTRLVGVHPKLVAAVTAVLNEMDAVGHAMFVVEGVRTATRQMQLYAQGRTDPGKIVTYRDGVRLKSNHQPHSDGYGYAADLAFANVPDPFADALPWESYGEAAENHGLSWGGRWEHPDRPHVELLDESDVRLT